MKPTGGPETSVTTNLRCSTSQNSEDLTVIFFITMPVYN